MPNLIPDFIGINIYPGFRYFFFSGFRLGGRNDTSLRDNINLSSPRDEGLPTSPKGHFFMDSDEIENAGSFSRPDSPANEPNGKEDFCLRKWLATEKGRLIVKRAAAGIVRDITLRALWGVLPSFRKGKPPPFDEAFEEIQSELVLFLCEKTSLIKIIIAGGEGGENYLKAAFINHLIDKSRHPDRDPYRYLYKRTLDCCRDSKEISITENASGSRMISLEPAALSAAALTKEDLIEISFPRNFQIDLTVESLGKRKLLLPLALHFAHALATLFGRKDVGVSLGDFIAWLSLYVDLRKPVEANVPLEHANITAENQDLDIKETDIAGWARSFAHGLSRKESIIFYLYFARNLSMAEIADAVKLNGPSGVHYHLQKSIDKCRSFIMNTPGIFPEDFSQGVFLSFQDAVFEILKKHAPAPYTEGELKSGVCGDEPC
jgi:hypothetical protein